MIHIFIKRDYIFHRDNKGFNDIIEQIYEHNRTNEIKPLRSITSYLISDKKNEMRKGKRDYVDGKDKILLQKIAKRA